MYVYPTLLPILSNREDLVLSVALFDDDTGDPIDLSGTTRAIPGDYTNTLWVVTDGPIITTSQAVLTIPDYPIGSQLQSVSLTVDPGLNILAGDLITIANLPGGTAIVGPVGPPPIPLVGEDGLTILVTEDSFSTLSVSPYNPGPNTMTGYVVSYNITTGALVVQIGTSLEFEIRWQGPHEQRRGYSVFYDIGTFPSHGPIITAQLGNGIQLTGVGQLEITIPAVSIARLHLGTYLASMTMTDSVNTRQVFVAQLPIVFGGVSRAVAPNPSNAAWEAIF